MPARRILRKETFLLSTNAATLVFAFALSLSCLRPRNGPKSRTAAREERTPGSNVDSLVGVGPVQRNAPFPNLLSSIDLISTLSTL